MNKIMEKQVYHLITALLLGAGVWITARGDVISGSFAGLSTGTWLALAVFFPVVHQFYVVLLWRGELYYQWLSSRFGERAFLIWGIGFMILFLYRQSGNCIDPLVAEHTFDRVLIRYIDLYGLFFREVFWSKKGPGHGSFQTG
jgi:hypothetical protein